MFGMKTFVTAAVAQSGAEDLDKKFEEWMKENENVEVVSARPHKWGDTLMLHVLYKSQK